MARFKIGALKINEGAIAPANQGVSIIQRVRSVSQVIQRLTSKSQVKQSVEAKSG